nr:hypothetical protein CFP56_47933 [Quercus suber]
MFLAEVLLNNFIRSTGSCNFRLPQYLRVIICEAIVLSKDAYRMVQFKGCGPLTRLQRVDSYFHVVCAMPRKTANEIVSSLHKLDLITSRLKCLS